MSWAAASFALLAVALAAGFAWYERSRPSARLLAVVGTLAALAILGRIAFAPVPNVKPTTDIVLIAGYALGGAPGFAVGAVSALGSNLFFGQGPWTPWQMAAWGLVGLLGAALAAVSGRRLGRVPLAVACGFAGVLYGVMLDLSTWVTFTGEHTRAQYMTIAATSLPFNVAHVAGNVAFFLAFGPGLIRAVERCRTRFEITWHPAPAALVVALLAATAALAPVGSAPAMSLPAERERAADYLEAARNADGGWGPAPRTGSSQLYSAWAAMGLAAASRPAEPATLRFLEAGARDARSASDLARAVLAVHAAGGDPSAAARRLRALQRSDGSFAGLANVTSYALMALRAAGEPGPPRAAADWLARQQNADGGLGFERRGAPSGVDDTAGAVMGMVAAGRRDSAFVGRAVAFLRRARRPDGGFPLVPGAGSNAQSTALAAQALDAAGRGPDHAGLAHLTRLQDRDGSLRYARASRQTPVWVTGQALVALAHQALPVARPRAAPRGLAGLVDFVRL